MADLLSLGGGGGGGGGGPPANLFGAAPAGFWRRRAAARRAAAAAARRAAPADGRRADAADGRRGVAAARDGGAAAAGDAARSRLCRRRRAAAAASARRLRGPGDPGYAGGAEEVAGTLTKALPVSVSGIWEIQKIREYEPLRSPRYGYWKLQQPPIQRATLRRTRRTPRSRSFGRISRPTCCSYPRESAVRVAGRTICVITPRRSSTDEHRLARQSRASPFKDR